LCYCFLLKLDILRLNSKKNRSLGKLAISPLAILVLNVTNSTSVIDVSSKPVDYFSVFTSSPVIAALIGAAITLSIVFYQRRQQQLNAILEAFKILNNDEHRQAREEVYSAFAQYDKGQKKIFENDRVRKRAAMVRADFDEIGLLVVNGLLPKEMFLDAYWNTIIISWKALRDDIDRERKRRRYPRYMTYFYLLYQEAEDFARRHDIDTEDVKPYYDDESAGAPVK
jgi:hypothetical protein